MRYWFDTEFIDDGRTIELISVGMVSEDNRRLYLENAEIPRVLIETDPWLSVHVLPHLQGGPALQPRSVIRDRLMEFVGHDLTPEFWAYVGAYDWIALIQLFGRLLDRPSKWPNFVRDVKQWAMHLKDRIPTFELPPPDINKRHNALADALLTRRAWQHCASVNVMTCSDQT